MDRGDGGGPPRKGSSLPRTLHGSLLQPGSQAGSSTGFTEESQTTSDPAPEHQGTPEYAAYPTHSLSVTPVPSPSRDPPPTFEEGSSRGPGTIQVRGGPAGTDRPYDEGRVGQQSSYAYQSSYRGNIGSTEPALYASAGPSTTPHRGGSTQIYSYPPPEPTQLPPVRALEQEAGLSSAGPSSRYQAYRPEDYRNPWNVSHFQPERADHPSYWTTDQWGSQQHRQEQQLRLDAAFQELSARSEPWVALPRRSHEGPHDHRRTSAPHQSVSADRSTIVALPEHSAASFHGQPTYPVPSGGGSSVPQNPSFLPHLQPYFEQPQYQPHPPPRVLTAPPTNRYGGVYPLQPEEIERVGPSFPVPQPPPPPTERAPSEDDHERASRRTSRPSEPRRSSKRKAREDDGEGDDDTIVRPRKIARKTQIACYFCRGRKLKCDGRTPTCNNCTKRDLPCQYAPYPKRRGPGKAPKGQRKLQGKRSAAPSSGYASATSTEYDVRPQTMPGEETASVASGQAPMPSSHVAGPSVPVAAPSPRVAMPSPSVAMPTPNVLAVYPSYPPVPSAYSHSIETPLDLHLPPIHPVPVNEPPPPGGFPHHLQYPAPAANPAAAPPAEDPRMRGLWRSASQARMTTTTARSREEGGDDEDSSTELYDLMRHDDGRGGGGGGGPPGGPPPPPPHAPARRGSSYR